MANRRAIWLEVLAIALMLALIAWILASIGRVTR